jgi:heat shock protein 4
VEIVGGATRVPSIQKALQDVFKVESVSKTLNASESIARGCAMMAAMRSPSFKVTEYTIEETNSYCIRVGWLVN